MALKGNRLLSFPIQQNLLPLVPSRRSLLPLVPRLQAIRISWSQQHRELDNYPPKSSLIHRFKELRANEWVYLPFHSILKIILSPQSRHPSLTPAPRHHGILKIKPKLPLARLKHFPPRMGLIIRLESCASCSTLHLGMYWIGCM